MTLFGHHNCFTYYLHSFHEIPLSGKKHFKTYLRIHTTQKKGLNINYYHGILVHLIRFVFVALRYFLQTIVHSLGNT